MDKLNSRIAKPTRKPIWQDAQNNAETGEPIRIIAGAIICYAKDNYDSNNGRLACHLCRAAVTMRKFVLAE
jgi:hypothetical protein